MGGDKFESSSTAAPNPLEPSTVSPNPATPPSAPEPTASAAASPELPLARTADQYRAAIARSLLQLSLPDLALVAELAVRLGEITHRPSPSAPSFTPTSTA